MERNRVNLSGSNTREEWILKKRGVTMIAASHPASMIPSHQRANLVSSAVEIDIQEHSKSLRILPQGLDGGKIH
jgi:hypothetical protein